MLRFQPPGLPSKGKLIIISPTPKPLPPVSTTKKFSLLPSVANESLLLRTQVWETWHFFFKSGESLGVRPSHPLKEPADPGRERISPTSHGVMWESRYQKSRWGPVQGFHLFARAHSGLLDAGVSSVAPAAEHRILPRAPHCCQPRPPTGFLQQCSFLLCQQIHSSRKETWAVSQDPGCHQIHPPCLPSLPFRVSRRAFVSHALWD